MMSDTIASFFLPICRACPLRFMNLRQWMVQTQSSIFFCITLATINSFKIFDQVNIITEGGPGFSTTVLVQAIYYYAFKEYKIGYAAAVALVLFLIIFAFSTVLQKLEEKFTY